ncbi:hypothetical protein MTO96_028543 [Rhipicephalus appendiculatus]
MFRVPLFLAVLSVALMAVGGYPSAFGYITSGFRSLADYKLGTAAKAGLEDIVDPDEGGAEHTADEQPDVSVEVIQPAGAPAPPPAPLPSKPQELPVDSPASTDPVHDFKQQFGAGYAALDFANQLEKRRLAAISSTTTKPQQFDAQVIPVPLDHYKDYVTGGDTGGSLMRVAVVAQNIPKLSYSSQPTGDSAQPWNQQGGSQVHLGQSTEQQQQPQTQDSRIEQSSQSYSGEQHQGHIFPYTGWPNDAQLSGYVAYPHSSYHVPDASGSDSTPEHATGEGHAAHYDKHHEGVVPGGQLLQHSKGTPDAESVPETTESTPASHVMESDASKAQQGPRYRREAVAHGDRIVLVKGRPAEPEADVLTQGPFKGVRVLDLTECMAKVFCTMAARPDVFGPQSANVTEYLRNVEEYKDSGMYFWKEASDAGSANKDCEDLYYRCTLPAESLKELIDGSVAV